MQGFGSERFAWRTRSTRSGGSRIGFLLVILSRGRGVLRGSAIAAMASRVFEVAVAFGSRHAPEDRAAKLGGAQRFLVTW
jgi:hypothetical protein